MEVVVVQSTVESPERERERERETCRFMGPTTFKWRRHKKCRYFLLAGTI